MRHKNLQIILMITSLLFTACSTFYGGTTNSEGSQSISSAPTEMVFEATVGDTLFRSVAFTNRSSGNYEITGLAFVDNLCGAFSVYSITDTTGNVLYTSGTGISVSIPAKQQVSLNVRFSPTSCEKTEYNTVFIIYYTDEQSTLQTKALSFTAEVTDDTPPTVECEAQSTVSYYDQFENPTIRSLPPLPEDKSYYLKVEKMSAYILPTEAFSQFATKVGTNINLDMIAPENRYQPVYIPITTDEAGNFRIATIDACVSFVMPSPITDNFFIGASIAVTTKNEFTGSVTREDDATTTENEIGELNIPDMQFNLHSYINNSDSLLQSEDGYFEVNISVDLTTTETETNPLLEELTSLIDDDNAKLLNIVDGRLVGKNIRHGTVRLVGIGQFVDDADAKMSKEGHSGLFDGDAFLFLQIDGIVTQEVE